MILYKCYQIKYRAVVYLGYLYTHSIAYFSYFFKRKVYLGYFFYVLHKNERGDIVFIDIFLQLCEENNVKPTRVANEIGSSSASVVKWKKGATPQGPTLQKIADYFGVTVDYLLNGDRPVDTEIEKGEITYDDFTYAMYGHSKELTEEQKQLLLKLAEDMRGRRGL